MKACLDILQNVLDNGHNLRNNRTGIPDIGVGYGATFIHDMSDGFPLITIHYQRSKFQIKIGKVC